MSLIGGEIKRRSMLLFRVAGDVFVLYPDHREEAEEMFAGRRRSFLLV